MKIEEIVANDIMLTKKVISLLQMVFYRILESTVSNEIGRLPLGSCLFPDLKIGITFVTCALLRFNTQRSFNVLFLIWWHEKKAIVNTVFKINERVCLLK